MSSNSVVTNVYDLIKLLHAEGVAAREQLIVIDGVGGAGKSTLGAQLAVAFGDALHVDLDAFLIEKQSARLEP